MNYADIKTIDIQDGTGVRVSIYVSGCHFHCKGCHNKEAWDFNYGKKFDNNTINYIIDLMNYDYIAGLSILGGEPLEPINQQELVSLVQKVKEKYPNKTIWCYTGYDFEKDVLNQMYRKNEYTKKLLKNIDIIVDGQFIEEQKVIDLKFRGSTNQKKIDVQASLKQEKVVQLKFGDESRYENMENANKSKNILYKEFKYKTDEVKENDEKVPVLAGIVDDEKIINIEPAYEITKAKETIAAENVVKNDNNINL